MIPKDVNVVVGDKVVAKIELPTSMEVKNFSLKSAKKTKDGFKIEVDWGRWEAIIIWNTTFEGKARKLFFTR
jgi:hypothetical protein